MTGYRLDRIAVDQELQSSYLGEIGTDRLQDHAYRVILADPAAGMSGDKDPVDAGLSGELNVRGDMRFLMQNAEMATVIFEVYSKSDMTAWPLGRPPYSDVSAEAI